MCIKSSARGGCRASARIGGRIKVCRVLLVGRRPSAHKTQHDLPGSKGSAALPGANAVLSGIPVDVPDSRVTRHRTASSAWGVGGGSKARWYAGTQVRYRFSSFWSGPQPPSWGTGPLHQPCRLHELVSGHEQLVRTLHTQYYTWPLSQTVSCRPRCTPVRKNNGLAAPRLGWRYGRWYCEVRDPGGGVHIRDPIPKM